MKAEAAAGGGAAGGGGGEVNWTEADEEAWQQEQLDDLSGLPALIDEGDEGRGCAASLLG